MILGDTTARIGEDAASLRLQLQVLSRQISTGRRADGIGDIAPDVPRAVALRTEIARRDTYDRTIDQAQQRAQVTQTVLSRLTAIGREFVDDVALKLNPDQPESLAPVASRARQALVEVGQLLNTKYAGEYVFGGSDYEHPPVTDPIGLPDGAWAQRIAAAVGTLGLGTAVSVAAQTLATVQDDTAGQTPFTAFLSDPAAGLTEPRRSVPSEDGVLIGFGVFANRNTAVTSSGETAGGWARDLMRGLMSLAALTPAQTTSKTDFLAFATTIRNGLRSATDAVGDEAGALGQTQALLDSAKQRHDQITLSLQTQLSGIQDTDMASAISLLQQTQTQLQASYQATARILSLSLASFLR